ncbi:uncharacterized protein LOC113294781 [Papaver somniferum]|uniref:uncharacterized protein LOC113294781 n=1 Tax=Papaver somniferum TaxID=3469 RepID=UPI000E6F5A40|nr:uncharacterized protein LOC113294781 [Papaver somniferum]
MIIQYFYEDFQASDRNLLDAAGGGALVNKTVSQARELIENMAANSQQFLSRGSEPLVRRVNEVSEVSELRQQMGNMEAMIQQIAALVVPSSPQLYKEGNDQVNVILQNQQRKRYDPYYNTYNAGWRDHPNFSYANKQAAAPGPVFNRPSGFQQQQPQQVQNSESSEMLGMMKNMTLMMQKNQQTIDNAIKELQTQVDTTTTEINDLKAQNSGKLPSQPLNPRYSVNVVTLRSCTRTVQPEDDEKNKDPKGTVLVTEITDSSQTDEVPKENSKTHVSTYVPPLHFPCRFANSKKAEQDKEILDIFRKIHVNIPLIDAIKQVPKYARILKDLCTNKQRLTGNEVMKVEENTSAIMQKKLPLKCKDPGSFDIPIVISNTKFNKAMLDLGTSVNVMPASV